MISNLIKTLLFDIKLKFSETIPNYLIKELKLLDKNTSIYNIHFPNNNELLEESIRRLKFEELIGINSDAKFSCARLTPLFGLTLLISNIAWKLFDGVIVSSILKLL